MSTRLRAVAALVSALASAAIGAQTVYRCGNEYTRVPCPNGKAVEVDNRTTAAQRAEAREVARREKQLGADMAHDRREEARAQQPALATSLSAKPAASAASAAPIKKKGKKSKKPAALAEERDFIAARPKVAKS